MATLAELQSEVYTGVGAGASMIPEMDIFLETCTFAASDHTTVTLGDSNVQNTLVPNLYVGCVARIENAASPEFNGFYVIKSNAANTITFNETVGDDDGDDDIDVTIMGFGAPAPAPKVDGEMTLLSDNWLGLVNSITPPNVDVELGQLNLAVAGSRNYQYQFKKGETVTGGAMDLSINNGMWLYYALGKYTSGNNGFTLGSVDSNTVFAMETDSGKIVRTIGGVEYPPLHENNTSTELETADLQKISGSGTLTYTFTEANGDSLPSFALDVSYEKSNISNAEYSVGSAGTDTDTADPDTNHADIYSRIFTGCQVNSLTLNFEEGQELKGSLDFVSRRAFDSPIGYAPKRKVRSASSMINYGHVLGSASNAVVAASATDIEPYLFSGGSIKIFGNTVAKVKSGSIAINNNITPQRFIGNYSRQITSQHIPGQRTYEMTLTMLITDTQLWNNLRAQGETTGSTAYSTTRAGEESAGSAPLAAPHTGRLEFKFEKSTTDLIELKFEDYIIQQVTVPFPEDKGPVEVEATISARTLNSATYTGKWAILHSNTGSA